ncbi:glycosyltransferase family 2 protein [Gaetbulibacter sp. M240]|uniref:glycosyltransferase family 2 protein n=1 Tax=Gaetbulibacter sp. M240 TaxID=3126511 RepID=UPI00374EF6E8
MLSILIPTYNFDAFPLASELHQQALNTKVPFEILVYNDASTVNFKTNSDINDLKFAKYKVLKKNIGRSAIRNLLGIEAKYNSLLFVDTGTFPSTSSFIKNYVDQLSAEVVSGGMIASLKKPEKPFKLRWLYTKKRESNKLCSSNFLIHKKLFLANPFEESITTYGYEDVLFFSNLKRKNISVTCTDNPVIHASDDDTDTFLNKTESALQNLKALATRHILDAKDSQILKYFKWLNTFGLKPIIAFKFKLFKNILLKNLQSNSPFLFAYDLYRIGYFCTLK